VPDALEDPRFRDNPLVRGEEHVRFYAGAPLLTTDRDAIGTLCVLDTSPRPDTRPADALRILSRQVMVQLELRRTLYELEETVERRASRRGGRAEQAQNLRALVQASPLAIMALIPPAASHVEPGRRAALRLGEAEVLGRRNPIVPPEKAMSSSSTSRCCSTAGPSPRRRSAGSEDGLNIRVTLSAAPLLDDEGRIKGVMAVLGRLCGRQVRVRVRVRGEG